MKRVLVLLKRSAYDVYIGRHRDTSFLTPDQSRVIGNLLDRHNVHVNTVEKCKDVLNQIPISWKSILRDELEEPIKDVDLVVTVGGDGTLLEASHYVNGPIPVLGVNSDPTVAEEVEERLEEYDATRSRGFFCAANRESFEQVIGDILAGRSEPKILQRLSISIDDVEFAMPALNDVLVAHPNPAAVSRCSFSIQSGHRIAPLIHTRSSGMRVCTAAGSTAATQSAGGYPMDMQSKQLQYMLREPILPHPKHKQLHGFIDFEEVMHLTWGCRQGCIYLDGAHVSVPIKFGSRINIFPAANPLPVFL